MVSPLVIGTAQFGQRYGHSGGHPPDSAEVGAILDLATESGCRALDTARGYGDSEAAIGAAQRAGHGAGLPVITKITPIRHGQPGEVVRDSLIGSRAALGRASLGTVLLHRAEDLAKSDAVDTLRRARASGEITAWGVSVGSPAELLQALDFPDLGYVQLPFNILDRRWLASEVQAALAARTDVTIAARSAFLQGILLNPDPTTWPTRGTPDAGEVNRGLVILGHELGRSPTELCLGYALAQPWISHLVVGVRSVDQLAGAIRAAASPLTASEATRVIEQIPGGSIELIDPSLWSRTS